jgi:hypothetical protein
MKTWLLPAAAAALTLMGGAAMAQPYGYSRSYDSRPAYGYGYGDGYGSNYRRSAYRDSDGDGVPDRAEWNRDRDHDGRPDQWDRYDNRRQHRHHRYDNDSRGYDRGAYSRYDYRY